MTGKEPTIRNPLKAKLAKGEAVWGTFVFEYGSPAAPRILKAAGWDYMLIDAELLLILQIETQAGLDHLDEILSVPGLNVAYLGPFDLSTSLGIPWELSHPRMTQATNAFLRGCERHGVIPGIWVNSVKDGRNWMRRGARFLTYGSDFLMVQEHSKQLLGALHPNRRPHGRSRR